MELRTEKKFNNEKYNKTTFVSLSVTLLRLDACLCGTSNDSAILPRIISDKSELQILYFDIILDNYCAE